MTRVSIVIQSEPKTYSCWMLFSPIVKATSNYKSAFSSYCLLFLLSTFKLCCDSHSSMQGKLIFSVLETEASRCHSGHEAPPMTHSLVLTPPSHCK